MRLVGWLVLCADVFVYLLVSICSFLCFIGCLVVCLLCVLLFCGLRMWLAGVVFVCAVFRSVVCSCGCSLVRSCVRSVAVLVVHVGLCDRLFVCFWLG